MEADINRCIVKYWKQWKPYTLILIYLRKEQGISRSLSWLKNKFKVLGLERRRPDPPLDLVRQILQFELKSSNILKGYRSVWKLLRDKYDLVMRRDTVMMLWAVLAPDIRDIKRKRRFVRHPYRSKGPNFAWHMDGYDKLHRFGLDIHACVDGFSRKIIWMNVTSSNSDPYVITDFYIKAVQEINGIPTMVVSDYGTENCNVATLHMMLRHNQNDHWSGEKSYRYVKSTDNLRSESMWSHLVRQKTGWWIKELNSLAEDGYYNAENELHRHVMAYVFVPLLRSELNEFVYWWNTHLIRPTKYSYGPHGVPNDMYLVPEIYGRRNQQKILSIPILQHGQNELSRNEVPFYPDELKELCDYLLHWKLGILQNDIDQCSSSLIYKTIITYVEQ